MAADERLGDQVIKHLEFIQAVIARLASDSFLMKGWALTVAAAAFGFGVKDLDWHLAAVGLLPLVAFWGLDAYFLSRERCYRGLYEAVRTNAPEVAPFSMNYRPFMENGNGFRCVLRCPVQRSSPWCAFWSDTLRLFYGSILLVGVAATVLTATLHH